MAFHAYLFFGGNCREAFTRYHEVFGGEVTILSWKDMPGDQPPPAGQEDMVMHAALMVGDALLMGSDEPGTDRFGPVQGMQVTYSTTDPADANRVFAALADGAVVKMPIAETFFSPAFGMLVDRFGTPWMISAQAPTDAA